MPLSAPTRRLQPAWLVLAVLVSAATFAAWLNADLVVALASQLWACF